MKVSSIINILKTALHLWSLPESSCAKLLCKLDVMLIAMNSNNAILLCTQMRWCVPVVLVLLQLCSPALQDDQMPNVPKVQAGPQKSISE